MFAENRTYMPWFFRKFELFLRLAVKTFAISGGLVIQFFPVDWKRGCRRADVAENSAYLKRQRKKVGDGARRKQHDERDDEYQP